MQYFVYELWVDGEEHPFYVGKSKTGDHRRYAHLWQAKAGWRGHKYNKIRKALAAGRQIEFRKVFSTDEEQLAFTEEKRLIAFYGRQDQGGCLTNRTDGGEGASGVSEEIIRRRMVWWKGRKRPPFRNHDEFRRKCAARMRGHKHSAETKEKMSMRHKGRKYGPMSEAQKQKLSLIRRARPRSPEAARKAGLSNRGKTRSTQTRRRMSESIARWNSAQRLSGLSAVHVRAISMRLHNRDLLASDAMQTRRSELLREAGIRLWPRMKTEMRWLSPAMDPLWTYWLRSPVAVRVMRGKVRGKKSPRVPHESRYP